MKIKSRDKNSRASSPSVFARISRCGMISKENKIKFFYLIGPILIILLFFVTFIKGSESGFDETIFNPDNTYNHIKELASPKYNGRMGGTEGNKLALKYIENYFIEIDIEPAGENGTYYQNLKSVLPIYQSEPYFHILDDKGKVVKEYKIREDYREMVNGVGGGGEVEGKLLHLDKNIDSYDKEQIKDKILLVDHIKNADELEKAVEYGAKAIISTMGYKVENYVPVRMIRESFWINSKSGKNIIIHLFEKHKYLELIRMSEVGLNAEIKFDVAFETCETPNILGKIEGRKKDKGYLIISGHVDHTGSDYDGRYFPGAFDDASGIAMMMELARVIKSQDILPEKTIIFAGWNNEEFGITGSSYYADNPLYPLSKTEVIEIDGIGLTNIRELILDSSGVKGEILRNKLFQYAKELETELNLKPREISIGAGSDHWPFVRKNIPAVLIQDYYEDRRDQHDVHTYKDDINNISKKQIQKGSRILLSYLKREVYKDTLPDYLNKVELAFIIIFMLFILLIYIIHILNQIRPYTRIFNTYVKDIYYSTPFNLLQKTFYYITPILIILVSLVLISHFPNNFNLVIENGKVYTNFSFYLVMKKTVLYIRNLFTNGLGKTIRSTDVLYVIAAPFYKSIKLLIGALTISFIIGIAKGMLDSYRDNKSNNVKAIGTLFTLSLPDVFVVVLIQILIVYMQKNNIFSLFFEYDVIRKYLIPMFCLSIIPAVYISRITFIIIQEEMQKEYIKAAKAKGVSRLFIFFNDILIVVIIKIINTLSSILTIIISNLIIVEYLFYYPGIAHGLLKAYKESDYNTFIGLSLSLWLVFNIFSLIFKGILLILNPLRKIKT